jgi:pSer/pThr/pTyr-binding forkhead associated (FHA) protein
MADLPIIKIHPPGHYVELDGDALFLGRECRLANLVPSLQDKVVSTRHCVIRREGERWMLEDLGATNGTWIRGRSITRRITLRTGDTFTLGKEGPRVECVAGFGAARPGRASPGTDASTAETLVVDPRSARTQPLDAPAAPARTVRSRAPSIEGSAERPFRVAGTPTLRLVRERTGEELTASGERIVIGRDPSAAQILIRADDERHVSGLHVEIRFTPDGRAVVRDLGSRNGTWLNDRRLKGEAPIEAGDRLVLGNAPTVLVVAAIEI